ncbi:glycosyltransferase [Streptomyces pactum]|uniref:Glycosyltransferase n=1 Tax=Streptomyces pactum TaxID=68249 RepID=A0ABS0NL55_9ACTN|nr:glycosyltransferase [Streptomyces pactum]MBH5335913.1 glycosyltransferase [Streptomyces pactum]
MSENPRVSVVIATRNGATTIARTLRSLMRQSMEAWEAIVVDGESEDDTAAIAQGMGDDRIRVHTVPHRSVGVSRNFGVSQARADVVAVLDSDDVWPEWTLALQLRALAERPDADAVFGDCRLVSEDGTIGYEMSAVVRHPAVVTMKDILTTRPVCGSTLAFRTGPFRAVSGYDPELGSIEDYDLYYRLVLNGARLVHIPRILATVTVSRGGMSNDIANYRHWMEIVLRRVLADARLDGPTREIVEQQIDGLQRASIPVHERAMRGLAAS